MGCEAAIASEHYLYITTTRGTTARGTQRSVCQNPLCARGRFLLDSGNRGCLPEVKQTIIDMRLNASGVRDTARLLHICPNTVRT
jgi:transposase-like protein